MNANVLPDKPYRDLINSTIKNMDALCDPDPKSWWRIFLRCVRSKTISYSTQKRRIARNVKLKLQEELEALESVPVPLTTAAQEWTAAHAPRAAESS